MTNMKAYIGIDPGMSGGLSIIVPGKSVNAYKMPETERDIWDLVHSLAVSNDGDVCAVIEAVSAMPKQGVTSTFTFGKGYGGLRMALIAAGVPFREVRPQVWQKALGCLTKGDKNISKAKAQQLFPSIKVTHALADSLLIAQWNMMTDPATTAPN